jgi:DNA-directed RNA polymerase specialized sigma24 family protein
MAQPDPSLAEREILRARAQGEVSAEESFERLYALHAKPVTAWVAVRVDAGQADDLMQDVWMIFFRRWQQWEFLPEMEVEGAKPVLSFLFRTCHLVLQGHRRRQQARAHEDVDSVDVADGTGGAAGLAERVEFGRCLQLAKEICTGEEQEVLLAKLAGVPAREIARTLGLSEPVVDHRFRDAVARLRQRLAPKRSGKKGSGSRGKNG